MPFRSLVALKGWLTEFETLEHPGEVLARVIEQDGSDGDDTGLIAVQLTSGLSVYLQPGTKNPPGWRVTIDGLDEPIDLKTADVAQLSTQFATVAALCAFLEAKALATESEANPEPV